jgi:hypothetical protein
VPRSALGEDRSCAAPRRAAQVLEPEIVPAVRAPVDDKSDALFKVRGSRAFSAGRTRC